MECLQAALQFTHDGQITSCIDSQSVIWGLAGTAPKSSQAAFLQWQDAAAQAELDGRAVSTRWCPGHMGIKGNERADSLCSNEMTWRLAAPDLPPTYARIRARMAERQRLRLSEWHRNHQTTGYPIEVWEALGYGTRRNRDLALPRDMLSRLVQSRTGHGDFPDYHEKYHHQDFAPRCGCGQDKRPGHIAFCREVRQLSDQRWPKELFHHAGGGHEA